MKPAKFQIIGQDEVVAGGAVAFQLLAARRYVEVNVQVFAFDVADRQAIPLQDKVGRAEFRLLRLVDDLDVPGSRACSNSCKALR